MAPRYSSEWAWLAGCVAQLVRAGGRLRPTAQMAAFSICAAGNTDALASCANQPQIPLLAEVMNSSALTRLDEAHSMKPAGVAQGALGTWDDAGGVLGQDCNVEAREKRFSKENVIAYRRGMSRVADGECETYAVTYTCGDVASPHNDWHAASPSAL